MKKIKTAVLTGGSSYIGKHVTKQLHLNGWKVIHLVRKKLKKKINSKIIYLKINKQFLQPSKLNKLNREKTVFIHLASYTSTKKEIKNLDNYINSNVKLGTTLLSFMHKYKFKKLIVSESYWQFDQQGNLGGNNLYSLTKSFLSMIIKYFAMNYKFSVYCLVLFDVYGPNDERKKILNTIINSKNKMSKINLTSGEQIMDYTFIDDVAKAFVKFSNKMLTEKESIFVRNAVRSMCERTFKDYIKILEKVSNYRFKIKWGGKKYPKNQIMKPWLPNSKWLLKSWSPKNSFEYNIKKMLSK